MPTRTEEDSLGKIQVPQDAYYGAQTQRALDNFPVSDLRLPECFIHSLALIKKCAAAVNLELNLLPEDLANAIAQAAQEVIDDRLMDQFRVDVFQTGSGTSTHMNANEVIAGRANEILTGKRGGKSPVHPNDHVNLGQSSNDVMPSALHVSALVRIRTGLEPALKQLETELKTKSTAFRSVAKIGRAHLQDAVPITLGQELEGYACQITLGIERLAGPVQVLSRLALGGTAVGTGLNSHPDFAGRVIARISQETGLEFTEAENHFEAQSAHDAAVETSGALKTLAVSLKKIANDIRWMGSGPRCGLGELELPDVQPGSSIMPGKVNPVIPEAVLQAAAQVIGNDTVITLGGQDSAFELNTMMPVIAYNLLQSIQLLKSSAHLLAEKCVAGMSANKDRCAVQLENSLALATLLTPAIGYDRAARVAQQAQETGKTIREVVLEQGILNEVEFQELLDRSLK